MKRLTLFCGLYLLIFSGLSFADDCALEATLFRTVSLGNVVVQRDAPVGMELARVQVPGYARLGVYSSGDAVSCYGGYTFNYLSATPSTISNDVFNTNLAGVGIRLSITPGDFTLPSRGSGYVYSLGDYDVILVKTAKITAGYLSSGIISQGWYVTRDNYFMQISLDASSQVTVLACSLASTVITFDLGDINAAEFSDRPGFTPGRSDSKNLGLDCDPGANINVELSGTQNPDAQTDASVLALSGQGSQGTADGVGIQLLYNDTPLRLNNRIVLKRSAGGQETFPLMARYYQTKSVVTPGSANAAATLNITYQ